MWRTFSRPTPLRWIVAAQFAALLVLGFVSLRPDPRMGAYRVLGDVAASRSGNVLAMFRPDTREAAMRSSLESAGARLVDGPTSAGAYILQVPDAEHDRALALLRHDPNVTMAEAIDRGPNE